MAFYLNKNDESETKEWQLVASLTYLLQSGCCGIEGPSLKERSSGKPGGGLILSRDHNNGSHELQGRTSAHPLELLCLEIIRQGELSLPWQG